MFRRSTYYTLNAPCVTPISRIFEISNQVVYHFILSLIVILDSNLDEWIHNLRILFWTFIEIIQGMLISDLMWVILYFRINLDPNYIFNVRGRNLIHKYPIKRLLCFYISFSSICVKQKFFLDWVLNLPFGSKMSFTEWPWIKHFSFESFFHARCYNYLVNWFLKSLFMMSGPKNYIQVFCQRWPRPQNHWK